MKSIVLRVALLFAAAIVSASSADEPKAASEPARKIKLQTHCPVMGGEIDRNSYVDHDGKRVYMCCDGCTGALKKNPAEYIKKLEDEGFTVAKLQTICPVEGGKIDKDLFVDHDGKRIYVCCQGCLASIRKDPGKCIKTLEEAGVALAPAGKAGTAGKAAEPQKE